MFLNPTTQRQQSEYCQRKTQQRRQRHAHTQRSTPAAAPTHPDDLLNPPNELSVRQCPHELNVRVSIVVATGKLAHFRCSVIWWGPVTASSPVSVRFVMTVSIVDV